MELESKDKDESILRWVTFRLEKEAYGINVTQVREVLRMTEIAPVPGAPDYVMGIINLRGNVVTVIETRKRFNLPSIDTDEQTRIVIIEVENQEVGILVDSVAEVVDLPVSAIESAPIVGNDDAAKYIQGVTSMDGELLILVDVNKFLTEEELQEMTSY